MEPLEIKQQTTFDPAHAGATDIKLASCDPAIVAQLPPTVEKLAFWWNTVPYPLRLDHLPALKSVNIIPLGDHPTIAIDALPPRLEKLSISSVIVERLPDSLPPLHELDFHSSDTHAVRWDRIPTTLRSVSAVRCRLPDPLQLPELARLESVSFYACNLRSARQLLGFAALKLVSLGLNPLDDESLAALMALGNRGVNVSGVKPKDFELTRQLYAAGVNLSAEKKGAKKIMLNFPLAAVAQAFSRDAVMALAERVQHGKAKGGQAFIDELRRQEYAAAAAAKAAKKAARAAAKKA